MFHRPVPLFHASLNVLLWAGIALLCSPANAQDELTLTGLPVVQDNGFLSINGQQIALWGVDLLAPDQQCWQGDVAWGCGEDAMSALKHYVGNKAVACQIKQSAVNDTPALAQCFRFKGSKAQDIAEHLILKGWAIERVAVSGGQYYAAEQKAQTGKYGIWTSRFQTAQDWQEGIQRFVGEEPEPKDEEQAEPDDFLDQDY